MEEALGTLEVLAAISMGHLLEALATCRGAMLETQVTSMVVQHQHMPPEETLGLLLGTRLYKMSVLRAVLCCCL